jgi:hypothetical protein
MAALLACVSMIFVAVYAYGNTGEPRTSCTPGSEFLGPAVGDALGPLVRDGGRALDLPEGIAVIGVSIEAASIKVELGNQATHACLVRMIHPSKGSGTGVPGRWFAAEEQGGQSCRGMGKQILERIEASLSGNPWTVCKGQPRADIDEVRTLRTSSGLAMAAGAFNILVLAAGLLVALIFAVRRRD